MKTKFLILATIAVATIAFSNNTNALEIRTYKDHTNDPDYILLKRSIEVILSEDEEITEEMVADIYIKSIEPKDKNLIVNEDEIRQAVRNVFANPEKDYEYPTLEAPVSVLKYCLEVKECGTHEGDSRYFEWDSYIQGNYKNLDNWAASYDIPDDSDFTHDLLVCWAGAPEYCGYRQVRITIDRKPAPQDEENKNPPQDNSFNQNQEQPKEGVQPQSQISAPNTGVRTNSIMAILPAITLLGSASFAFRHKK